MELFELAGDRYAVGTSQRWLSGDAVTVEDVAKAHAADLQTQDARGVHYLRYWVDEPAGTIFCLVDAPDAEAANRVHREAHGLVADEVHLVVEGD